MAKASRFIVSNVFPLLVLGVPGRFDAKCAIPSCMLAGDRSLKTHDQRSRPIAWREKMTKVVNGRAPDPKLLIQWSITLLRRSHGQRTTSKFWAARGDVGRPRTTTFRSCDVHPPWACVLTCGWASAIFATAISIPTLPQACYSTIGWKSNPCTTRVLNHQILLSLSRVQCVAIGPHHHFFFGRVDQKQWLQPWFAFAPSAFWRTTLPKKSGGRPDGWKTPYAKESPRREESWSNHRLCVMRQLVE